MSQEVNVFPTPRPQRIKKELLDLPIFLPEINKLELKDEILYRKRQIDEGTKGNIVLPETFRDKVMKRTTWVI